MLSFFLKLFAFLCFLFPPLLVSSFSPIANAVVVLVGLVALVSDNILAPNFRELCNSPIHDGLSSLSSNA